ncbi:unnamed protein product [Cylindrotheca closterium]|uniref:Uncharacterized protein n=1 Tax=Cylindrotheca closterium TaxID=2856 RepID=A0AAD2FNN5_9STRA|nr:unnamed protein product [Cylindrotheca closterium]CAJ1949660.1 unnamed protein product [Cylindrotheca closterium]
MARSGDMETKQEICALITDAESRIEDEKARLEELQKRLAELSFGPNTNRPSPNKNVHHKLKMVARDLAEINKRKSPFPQKKNSSNHKFGERVTVLWEPQMDGEVGYIIGTTTEFVYVAFGDIFGDSRLLVVLKKSNLNVRSAR